MATYTALPTTQNATTAYTRQYAFRQTPELSLVNRPALFPNRFVLADTSAKLQEGRDSRVYSALLQEFARKEAYFPGVTKESVLAIATQLMAAVCPLGGRTTVLGLTYDPGLNLRTELNNGLDTLHVEVSLGPDADAEEDTFVSLRRDGRELWGASGAMHTLLPRLAELKELTTSR